MKNKRNSRDQKKVKPSDYQQISFILFIIGFFFIFAIRPSISLIYTLQKEKSDYEKINETLEVKIQQIITTQEQFMQLINNKSLIDEALPSTHQISITKKFLIDSVEITNFTIQKIIILPPNPGTLNTVKIELAGQGDYKKILKLIGDINNSRRLISIDFLSMEPDKQSTESGQINFNGIFDTFYYPESI
jgi:Tfp pilus assembly protein PilO